MGIGDEDHFTGESIAESEWIDEGIRVAMLRESGRGIVKESFA
jgi:hypothetical protein